MSLKTINMLLIEDSPGDSLLIQEAIKEAGSGKIKIECVERLDKGLNRLARGGIDIVLLDLSLPDSLGLNTFSKLHTAVPSIPIIVLSGHDDELIALNAVQEGALEYLIKGQADKNKLVQSIQAAIQRYCV